MQEETWKQRIASLESEVSVERYEKRQLESAFESLRHKVEERVPVISEVEKRRVELEKEVLEKTKELRNS